MKRSEAKQAVLVFGPPGAGKGTQAELLAAKFEFVHFEMSKALEHWIRAGKEVEIEGKRYLPEEQKLLWESGILMDPPLVAHIGIQEVRRLFAEGKSIVTSGAFRTSYEAERVYPVLRELYGKENIRVVNLTLGEKETLFRNSHRRICELVRHPVLWLPETENLTLCPLDGSKLVRREGLDDPKTIPVRLKEYEERTLPVLDFLRSAGVALHEVNGEQSVADVFGDIVKALS